MLRNSAIALMIGTVVMLSGCLGAFGDGQGTATIPKGTTQWTSTTPLHMGVSNSTPGDITHNLSECRSSLYSLRKELNESIKTQKALSNAYQSCQANLSAIHKLNETLTSCRIELKEALRELNNITYELNECARKGETGRNGTTVKLLTDEEYYNRVIEAIEHSKKTVYVMMFFMKYDPGDDFDWANDLIRALVSAKKRGVDVHVLLDERIKENMKAYRYLSENGVDVAFDSPNRTLHAKVIVIDGRVAFIGSHNWSEGALYWNHEVSVEVDSEKVAKRLVEYFRSIKNYG